MQLENFQDIVFMCILLTYNRSYLRQISQVLEKQNILKTRAEHEN